MKVKVKPRKRPSLSVFDQHQLAIAAKTLRMSDVGAMIMGGMTKDEARAVIFRLTGKKVKEVSNGRP